MSDQQLEALFTEHHDALLRHLTRYTGDRDQAADAMQEAFLRLVLLMREAGFRHRESAEAVGTTTKSVGTMIARALRKLAAQATPTTEALR